jgi:hypothetical protein
MPASSIDTFFACSLMVILIVSAMAGTTKVVQPYLDDLAHTNDIERHKGLAEYLLVCTGNPANWGAKKIVPSAFGLSSEIRRAYELDIDKVTRLNSHNIHSITYPDILDALGTTAVSVNIKIHTLFEVAICLTSKHNGGMNTTYAFQITTTKSGFPIPTWLRTYTAIDTYVEETVSDAPDGRSELNATLSNSLNGTAILIVFAQAKACPQVMAVNAYLFGHNADSPEPNHTFLRLSPLSYLLNVSSRDQTVELHSAHVFTYTYHFMLPPASAGNQTVEYTIPRLSEASPLVLLVNGKNGSTSFAEWTTYPQLPLEIDPDFNDSTARSNTVAAVYVVSVGSVLYQAIITCRSVQNIDV